jgi:hypothetical protein
MGSLIGPGDCKLAADGVDGVEMDRSPRRTPAQEEGKGRGCSVY